MTANCLRAGVAALQSALDAVNSGSVNNVLVTVSDVRVGAPGGEAEQSFGDGLVDRRNSGVGTDDTLLPDELDLNEDGTPDCYDGGAEFDDLASSIYHAWDPAGLTHGGDGILGEVTSAQMVTYPEVECYWIIL